MPEVDRPPGGVLLYIRPFWSATILIGSNAALHAGILRDDDDYQIEINVLKLTKKTDYALMALHHMGFLADERLVNAKEIAEIYQIPVEMMAKILQTLSREGLIVSENGPKGGYALSRLPKDISVAEVIEVIEGPIGIADCVQDAVTPCLQADTCTIRTPVAHIQARISALLTGMSVAEVHAMSAVPAVSMIEPG